MHFVARGAEEPARGALHTGTRRRRAVAPRGRRRHVLQVFRRAPPHGDNARWTTRAARGGSGGAGGLDPGVQATENARKERSGDDRLRAPRKICRPLEDLCCVFAKIPGGGTAAAPRKIRRGLATAAPPGPGRGGREVPAVRRRASPAPAVWSGIGQTAVDFRLALTTQRRDRGESRQHPPARAPQASGRPPSTCRKPEVDQHRWLVAVCDSTAAVLSPAGFRLSLGCAGPPASAQPNDSRGGLICPEGAARRGGAGLLLRSALRVQRLLRKVSDAQALRMGNNWGHSRWGGIFSGRESPPAPGRKGRPGAGGGAVRLASGAALMGRKCPNGPANVLTWAAETS